MVKLCARRTDLEPQKRRLSKCFYLPEDWGQLRIGGSGNWPNEQPDLIVFVFNECFP